MEYKKHKFPVQLLIFFEKVSPSFWSSKVSRANCFFLFLPSSLSLHLSVLLKNELFLGSSYLVDASCVDLKQPSSVCSASSKALVFYMYYFFFLKKRIIFCFSMAQQLQSIDYVYPSAGWLEREFSEMFGVYLDRKLDSRNLLLDYSLNENPLLKSFPSVGFREVHYSMLAESVVYTSAAAVEL